MIFTVVFPWNLSKKKQNSLNFMVNFLQTIQKHSIYSMLELNVLVTMIDFFLDKKKIEHVGALLCL